MVRFKQYGDAGRNFLNGKLFPKDEDSFIASLIIHLYAAVILKSGEFERNLLPLYYSSSCEERIRQYRTDFVSYAESQQIDLEYFLSSNFASTQFFKDYFDQSVVGKIQDYGKTNGYALYDALYQDDCLIELESCLAEANSLIADPEYFEASKLINYLILGEDESLPTDAQVKLLKSTILFIKILYLDD